MYTCTYYIHIYIIVDENARLKILPSAFAQRLMQETSASNSQPFVMSRVIVGSSLTRRRVSFVSKHCLQPCRAVASFNSVFTSWFICQCNCHRARHSPHLVEWPIPLVVARSALAHTEVSRLCCVHTRRHTERIRYHGVHTHSITHVYIARVEPPRYPLSCIQRTSVHVSRVIVHA